jgi:hypothetical protein
MVDHKQALLHMLKGKKVKGYHLNLQEDENKIVASLTNSAVRKLIDLDGIDVVILRYIQMKDKKKRTTRMFKSEVDTNGSNVAIIVRDLGTNRAINKYSFPSPTPYYHPGSKGFKTL